MPVPAVKIDRYSGGAWRITCSPRDRMRKVASALGGMVAGLLLAVVSVSGLLSALAGKHNGAELFVLGWLGPLAVISALLIWVAVSLVFRAVKGFEVECDGTVVSVVRFSPHSSKELMRCPITECELLSGGTDLAFRFARPGSGKKEVLDTHYRLSPEEHLAIERLFLIREPSGNA
ncbi:MAG TPA: hypothetical protein PK251_14285 [Candidatus Latescibacteria bacterium]|nr:hypothetical protein [Candidatus Latescibacterota bacterium]HOF61439.1 hypothetical protein [Candidatus Latescibacterota bacterium]HOS65909.1 hypothetical protein [Candidatus Latescibacterota bacterium]HPK73736.1 hypothetical protein [Candidatus Latescibacterota bacterium]